MPRLGYIIQFLIRIFQVSLKSHPVVESVWVTMSPGAFQKFAIFVVEILDGNTAEYKPCAQFEGRFTEQLAKFKCNDGAGQLGQFVYIRDDRVDREYFGLCEVQVFEKRGNDVENMRRKAMLSLFPEIPDCGVPESPVYSIVTPVGPRTVQYSCMQGYILAGNNTRNCTEQGWVGGVPTCQGIILYSYYLHKIINMKTDRPKQWNEYFESTIRTQEIHDSGNPSKFETLSIVCLIFYFSSTANTIKCMFLYDP